MTGKKTNSRIYGGIDAQLRVIDRKNRLIEAGIEAFGTEGYAKTAIKTICGLAGLTERYFYESFKSKEELLIAVYRQITDEMTHDSMSVLMDSSISPTEAARQACREFYRYFREDPRKAQIHFFEILGVSRAVDKEYQDATKLLVQMLKHYLSRVFPGLTKERLDQSKVATGLAGSMVMICAEWILEDFKTPLDNIVKETMDFFLAMGRHLEAEL
jgi:AcrR family transcriptional regulator